MVNGEIFVGSKAYEKIYGTNFLIGLRLGSALRKGIEFRDNIHIYTDILSGLSIFNFPKTKCSTQEIYPKLQWDLDLKTM